MDIQTYIVGVINLMFPFHLFLVLFPQVCGFHFKHRLILQQNCKKREGGEGGWEGCRSRHHLCGQSRTTPVKEKVGCVGVKS